MKIEKEPDGQITDRTYIVDQEGIVFHQHDISSLEPTYEQFYYGIGKISRKLMKKMFLNYTYFRI
ncbi:hypothetical protein [Pseudalkalibacillus salsuginis]|uniref:hypothetical protein n=1 Tax=Pseudalkalibacillus salsuginis TaxID=2910972 RepID=UPI001F22D67D|nr:hypothetical protein [Pseudalkalibacillus salsuginis]MCF6411200.1 hypothetical protein [Pseudalkalibacillus salsuginis]